MYRQRIVKEAKEAVNLKDENMVLIFNEANLLNWTAYLLGPEDSPFEQGIFQVKITLTQDYPIKPPKMIFKTRIFHPNIHWETGEICLDIVKSEWTPSWTLESLCRAVLSLMSNPNADSPLNCDAGNLVRNGYKDAYNQMAEMYTQEFAINKQQFNDYQKQQISQKEQLSQAKNIDLNQNNDLSIKKNN